MLVTGPYESGVRGRETKAMTSKKLQGHVELQSWFVP